MTAGPGGWSRVRELFDRAIALPAASRSDLVDELAGGDDALRNDVLELLRQYDSKDPGFKAGLDAFFNREPDVSTGEWVGRRIGPYRVVREIGRGGMGSVYEAERDDAEYAKRVAIKLLRPGMQSAAMVQRFKRERQILAALEHPNIARLLDGGMTSDERPYLVMEYFDGSSLDRYCDEHRLSVRERIALFMKVCEAVEYAHRNLVVHRDLKPGNVLVTNGGIPKLLDFGVAKLLQATDAGEADATTREGRFLTPEYASPEQLRDEPVTTVSDVYSLGLILYELLAGFHPFRAIARSPPGFDRILTTDPARPSTTVTDQAAGMRAEHDATRLRRRLSGEIDNIVLTAIRKEPSRRYASVQRFADDLRRYLDGEPVSAQKDTRLYRARKFAVRNRGGVAAAAFVAVSLMAGVSATLWQADRARAEAARAESERDNAQQITAFLQNLIGAGDPSWYSKGERPGPQTTVLEAVGQTASRIDELNIKPDAEATIRRTIGNTYQALGMVDSAETQLRAALALRRGVASRDNLDLARDLHALATTSIHKGDFREAAAFLREALSIHAETGDSTSLDLATLTNDLSVALARGGDLAAAEPLALRTLALHRSRYGDAHPTVAIALNNMGFFTNARGDLDASERYAREAIATYDRLKGREFFERATTLFNLGIIRKWRGAYGEADSLYRESFSLFSRMVGPQHPYILLTWIERAHAHYLSANLAAAEAEIAQAQAFVRVNGITETHPDAARLATVRGLVLVARGRAADAVAPLRRALAIRQSVHGPFDMRTMETTGVLGLALAKSGRKDEGESLLTTAYAKLSAQFGPTDPRSRLVAQWRMEASAPASN